MATLGEYGTSDEMVSHICSQLAEEFTGMFSPETIKRFVSESFESLSTPECKRSYRCSSIASPKKDCAPPVRQKG